MARILVIDDDETVVATIRLMLETGGHEVRQVEPGTGALDAIRREPVDLVITDLLMPEQDGIEIIKQIGALKDAPPVLAISGGGVAGNELYLRAAGALGAADTLPKPFTSKSLLGKVEMLLRQRKGA
jgi:DNA-binding response OmpR family regulator